ncbi:MAG: allophycocyanin subunit beta [Cyanobacteria bacterium P01_F01_bin.53]
MRDTVTSLISNYDTAGRYLDRSAIDSLQSYFNTGVSRVTVVAMISAKAAEISREASKQLFEEVPDLLRPGGYAYTTRRYAACLRDMDYYLRYSSYALVAGNNDVLLERVLQGLRETYNSLGVPIGPTVQGIQIMKDMVKEMATDAGIADTSFIDQPFDFISREISEVSF